MAAWLAYLKSAMLLPKEEQEDPSPEELALKLQLRLQRLGAMRDAAARLMGGDRIGRELDRTFPTVLGRYFRLDISKASSGPTLWNWELFRDQSPEFLVHRFDSGGEEELEVDISRYFTKPGPYKIAIRPRVGAKVAVHHFEPLYNHEKISDEIYRVLEKDRLYLINRTDQIVESSTVQLKLRLGGDLAGTEVLILSPSY